MIAAAGQIAPAVPDGPKLKVFVLGQSHLPVLSALVEITLQDRVIATMSTDQAGSAALPALKPACYTVSASKEGFESPVLEYRNGFPYSVVNAFQQYVGIPDSTRFPRFLSLDARVERF